MAAQTDLILKHLLEDDDGFDDLMDANGELNLDYEGGKFADFQPEEDKGWVQIDGDANPWEYGGSWYNKEHNLIWHFDGLDALASGGDKVEIEPDDVQVPDRMRLALERRWPSDYIDPDGDLYWQERERNANERERDNAIDNYQYTKAKKLNLLRQQTFYAIGVPDKLYSWMRRHIEDIASGFGCSVEDFEAEPMTSQILRVGEHLGFDSVGEQFQINRIDARKELGIKI
jgi:hypothetical protein